MDSPTHVSHAELARAVTQWRLGVSASELHGALAGFLCAGGAAGADQHWLQALQLEPADAEHGGNAHRQMAELARQTHTGLDDPGLGFTPLLPGEDETVAERARALLDWCQGFLGGLGLADVQGQLPAAAAEVVQDFARIATTRDSFEGEDDEASLIELVEFVRVGALLLRDGLAARPDGAPPA